MLCMVGYTRYLHDDGGVVLLEETSQTEEWCILGLIKLLSTFNFNAAVPSPATLAHPKHAIILILF